MIKLYDGEFQIFDVNGLNVFVLSSISRGTVDIFINYPRYEYMMKYCSVDYDEFNVENIEFNVERDFALIMKKYFIEVEKLEEKI